MSLEQIQIINAFPEIMAPLKPIGEQILVQMRLTKNRTKSGFYLPNETQLDERFTNFVAKVVAFGDLAFTFRGENNGPVPIPEGKWYNIGDYVRVPQHGMGYHHHRLTPEELQYIADISKQAREASCEYVAEDGLDSQKSIRFGLCHWMDVRALMTDPLSTGNGTIA